MFGWTDETRYTNTVHFNRLKVIIVVLNYIETSSRPNIEDSPSLKINNKNSNMRIIRIFESRKINSNFCFDTYSIPIIYLQPTLSTNLLLEKRSIYYKKKLHQNIYICIYAAFRIRIGIRIHPDLHQSPLRIQIRIHLRKDPGSTKTM